MASPTVSVAMCTYNGARFVREQLQSILAQSRMPDELVICDDGSTDATLAVVRSVIESLGGQTEVRLLENAEPLGVAGNFEHAIRSCSGDVIVLSDQDDVWSGRRIERILAAFDANPRALLVHSDARLVDETGAAVGPSLLEAIEVTAPMRRSIVEGGAFELLLKRNLVTGATAAIRRELAQLALPIPAGWLHDEWLAIVAGAVDGIALVPEPLLDYRQHGDNAIGAAKLSFAGKLGRMLEPGRERNSRLLRRAASLAERLPHLDAAIGPDRLDAARRKLAHETVRSRLSRHRLARIVPVVRQSRLGAYREFGRGPADAARDLLQPL